MLHTKREREREREKGKLPRTEGVSERSVFEQLASSNVHKGSAPLSLSLSLSWLKSVTKVRSNDRNLAKINLASSRN